MTDQVGTFTVDQNRASRCDRCGIKKDSVARYALFASTRPIRRWWLCAWCKVLVLEALDKEMKP